MSSVGVRIFGEVVVDLGREGVRLAGKLRQFPVVDLLCLVVMRRECDIARLFVRSEVGNVPLIQFVARSRRRSGSHGYCSVG